jgi:hypothetical protein
MTGRRLVLAVDDYSSSCSFLPTLAFGFFASRSSLCGLHIRHPARWCFGLFLLWFIVTDSVSGDLATCCPAHCHERISASDPCQSKICLDCGHRACPFCETWCDRIMGDDGDLCCEGECRYVLGPAEGVVSLLLC